VAVSEGVRITLWTTVLFCFTCHYL